MEEEGESRAASSFTTCTPAPDGSHSLPDWHASREGSLLEEALPLGTRCPLRWVPGSDPGPLLDGVLASSHCCRDPSAAHVLIRKDSSCTFAVTHRRGT